MKVHKILALATVTAFILSCSTASADTISLNGGSNYLLNTHSLSVGMIINGVQGQFGGQADRDVYMANHLLSVAIGGTSIIPEMGGEQYTRSTNNFGALPPAIATGAVFASGSGLDFGTNSFGNTVSLTLAMAFQYLVVAYDGPNGGVMVYDISGMHAGDVIQMARNAEPFGDVGSQVMRESTRYQMTGWTLLNPGQTVPDGGTTLMLLGAGLGAIAFFRRSLRKKSPTA
ncbi:MAG: VPDSG-CTERM sorting domain-containing protein [Chthoniobacterales bacterium]